MLKLSFILLLLNIKSPLKMTKADKFEMLAEKIYFNVRIFNPDINTSKFINKYIPFLTQRPKPGGWTAYPSHADTSPTQIALHSFYFKHHAFLDLNIKEGRFDIYTTERNSEAVGLYGYQLWLFFNDKRHAEKAFSDLESIYDEVSTSKTKVEKGSKKIITLRNSEANKLANTVQFILVEDELYTSKYKISCRIGFDPDVE